MPELALSGKYGEGKFTLVDQDVFDIYKNTKIYMHKNGYAFINVKNNNGKRTNALFHRLIMNAPKGMQVDHINHTRLDNRRENLRIVTAQQNHFNRSTKNKYKNVSCRTAKNGDVTWRVIVSVSGTVVYREIFDDEINAARASDWAMLKYQGEHANLNFKDFDYSKYIPMTKDNNYTSNYVGVYSDKKKSDRWLASVGSHQDRVVLGLYYTDEDAATARDLYIIKNGLKATMCRPNHEYDINIGVKTVGKSKKKCKYVGVIPNKNKYSAIISLGRKTEYIGSFSTELDAAIARDKYIIENGINKKLNFPQPDA